MARSIDTRYREPNIVERDHHKGSGLLVWAGIATNGRTDLYVFAGGSVTAVRYRDAIIHPLVRPFIVAIQDKTIWGQAATFPYMIILVAGRNVSWTAVWRRLNSLKSGL
ncbi:hypothetical protein AVEN_260531-1 [Araneus ventricosus]|uniref:Uncharacterized protein n=1 Tax=Araneus ventricosus TaxID=182803 RepID=A0A4Y2MM80_ARAVE|nr:hypothetical protein AVEN_260531-1 [Araneus ventricosus]